MLGPFVIPGRKSITGVTSPLTEQQQGGIAPEPETNVSVADQAIEEPVGTGAVAVADDPAETSVEAEAVEAAAASAVEAADQTQGAETRPSEGAPATLDETDHAVAAGSSEEAIDAPAAEPPAAPPPQRDLGPEPTTMEELLAEQ